MTRITVRLPGEALEALTDLSIREYREPADQAAYLIVDNLRRLGVLEEPKRPTSIPTADPRGPEAAA